jgi:hypothetical protein
MLINAVLEETVLQWKRLAIGNPTEPPSVECYGLHEGHQLSAITVPPTSPASRGFP